MYKNKRNILLGILLCLTPCFFINPDLFSQEIKSKRYLDSLYNRLVLLDSPASAAQRSVAAGETEDYSSHKCGFPLRAEINSNFSQFSLEQQKKITENTDRPSLHTSIISPSGHFRIYYDTTGANLPQYDPALSSHQNVRILAQALDSAYSFEVNFMKFPPPPTDSLGGSEKPYDVYIENLVTQEYGFTQPGFQWAPNKYLSYIEIDNDFKENYFYTKGLVAARATAAHEFHHSIQVGRYKYTDEDLFFHELTSTSMEEFVFSTSNDYYIYMKNYLIQPEKRFSSFSGYDIAIWNIFLKERFGYDIIKRQWEFFVNNPALNAINLSLLEHNSSFRNELNEFGIWSFYTNYRAIPGKYFPEAANYPAAIRPKVVQELKTENFPFRISTEPLSNFYMGVLIKSSSRIDTIISKITDGDLLRALDNPLSFSLVDYSIGTDSVAGSKKVVNNYYSLLSGSNLGIYQETDFFNNILVNGDVIEYSETDFAYPNPFNYHNRLNNDQISLPVQYNDLKNAEIYIYTAGLNLVYSGNRNIFADPQNNKFIVTWDGKDSKGNRLKTGVYIYVINSNGNIKKGKIVIQNEQ